MCTFHEESLRSLKETQLRVWRGNRFEPAISFESVRRVIRVQDRAEDGGEVCFLPDSVGGLVSVRGKPSIGWARTGTRNDVPFAPQVYNVRIHASGDLDVYANVHAGKRVEAAETIA